jgi:hypothetical protein
MLLENMIKELFALPVFVKNYYFQKFGLNSFDLEILKRIIIYLEEARSLCLTSSIIAFSSFS